MTYPVLLKWPPYKTRMNFKKEKMNKLQFAKYKFFKMDWHQIFFFHQFIWTDPSVNSRFAVFLYKVYPVMEGLGLLVILKLFSIFKVLKLCVKTFIFLMAFSTKSRGFLVSSPRQLILVDDIYLYRTKEFMI